MPNKSTRAKPKSKMAAKSTKKSKEVSVDHQEQSNIFRLAANSLRLVTSHWKQFGIVSFIYFLLSMLLVRGFSATINIVAFKSQYIGNGSNIFLKSNFSALGNVITSGLSGTSANGNLYQTLLFVVFSIIFIWMFREISNKNKVTVRDSFYRSQTPLIQYIIVLVFLSIEMAPAILGLFLYGIVFSNNIAVNGLERFAWIIVCGILVAVTFYLLVSSIFAIYIVTLPGMRPFNALKSSWKIVKKRRFVTFGKLILMPIGLLVSLALIDLIFIIILPQIADYIYFILSIIAVLLAHSYIYSLYRELI